MKKFFQVVILVLIPYFVLSQAKIIDNTKVKVGKPYPVIDAEIKYYREHNDKIYCFKKHKDELYVQMFDANKLILKTFRTYKDFPDGYVVENIKILGNKCLLFYSLWDKKNRKEQLFYRELDMKTGEFIGKGDLLFKVDDKVSGSHSANGLYSFEIVDKFKIETAFDTTKILIRYRKDPKIVNDDKNYDIIGFRVYDLELNELWSKEVKMPYTEGNMDNLDYYVNDKAEVYILARVFTDNSHAMKIKKGKANYYIELLKIQNENDEIEKYPVSLGAKLINSITLFQANENKLVLGGYYAKEEPGYTDGIFAFTINDNGKIISEFTYEFPLSFLNQNATNKEQRKNNRKDKKGKAEFPFLSMDKIVTSDDGSITLIGEQYYKKDVYNSKNQYVYTEYFYRDIIISKIDADGELVWNKRLPKFQKGRQGMMDMSYDHYTSNGKHYFLFLDNIKNKDLEPDECPKTHSSGAGGWLTAYIVNSSTGDISKSYILDTREVNDMPIYQFSTKRILKISSNEFVFEVYKKKKEDVLIKVTFE